MDKMRIMLDSQTNTLMEPLSPITMPAGKGVYELVWSNSNEYNKSMDGRVLVGLWKTNIGENIGQYISLWQHASLDNILKDTVTPKLHSKLLIPFKFSPLQ